MPTRVTASLAAAFAIFSSVDAHGVVSGIVAGGKYYTGYSPSFKYQNPPPTVAGWSIPEDSDIGYVGPDAYANPDIICHKGATPGGAYVTVVAGGTIELQWTKWPESHHGPVIDYLANCNGECTSVEKTSLKFNKIDELGLLDDSNPPGSWASDKLIAANNSWTTTIPKCISPGNYVLRHEIIALHSSSQANGAQNYPQCVNIKVTGSGTDQLTSGTAGTALYKSTDPGILVSIYQKLTYLIPGPKLYSCGSSPLPASSSLAPPVASSSRGPEPASTSEALLGTEAVSTAYPTITTIPLSNYTSPLTTRKTKSPCPTTFTLSTAASSPVHSSGPASIPDYPVTQVGNPVPTSTSASSLPEGSASSGGSVLPSSVPDTPTPGIPGNKSGETPSTLKYKWLKDLTVEELFELLKVVIAELKAKVVGGQLRRHARDFLGMI
ncbi:MAG: hypothetical protein Q9167_000478 [Letrouitia subvulpina]